MNKMMLPFLLCFLSVSCSFVDGVTGNENDDNLIYLVGKKFTFDVSFISAGEAVTRTEKLELLVTDDIYPAKIQTAITWLHYKITEGDTNIIKNTTGVEESADRFWIHPPREGDMEILSFTGFPDISQSLLKLSKEQRALTEVEGSGKVAIIRTYKGINVNGYDIKSKYEGMEKIDLPIGSALDCDKISTEAVSAVGTIKGVFHFHEKYGFVRFDYLIPNQDKIIIQLRAVE